MHRGMMMRKTEARKPKKIEKKIERETAKGIGFSGGAERQSKQPQQEGVIDWVVVSA
jgi:hypothetical protein